MKRVNASIYRNRMGRIMIPIEFVALGILGNIRPLEVYLKMNVRVKEYNNLIFDAYFNYDTETHFVCFIINPDCYKKVKLTELGDWLIKGKFAVNKVDLSNIKVINAIILILSIT